MIKTFSGLGKDTSKVTNTAANVDKYKSAEDVFGDKLKDTRKNELGDVIYTTDSDVDPKIFSSESVDASFETLFNDFDLQAFSFYNFWTDDETTNDREDVGNRKLEDLPRFVKLSWLRAPDVYTGEDETPSYVGFRKINDVIFSRDSERKNVHTRGGISFAPEHLQTTGFSKVKNFTVNGFISPGVIEAIVEMKVKKEEKKKFDESSFLASAVDGISVSEMLGQSNSVDDVKQVSFDRGSSKIDDHVSNLVDSFSTENSAVDSIQTKVKFINPAITGIVSEQKVSSISSPEHVESMVSIATVLPQLEIMSKSDMKERTKVDDIPSFPSPKLKSIEYIGYVIEKYVLSDSGVFKKIDEIDIPNRDANFYIDSKVLYGKTYRYRIKSIMRWTRESNVDVKGKSKEVSKRFGDQTTKLAMYKSSFFSTEWCRKWAYASCIDMQPPSPPDELTVRPESHRNRIVVTFRIPDDSQKDISKMVLLRKLKDANGKDITSWEELLVVEGENGSQPKNTIYFDENLIEGRRYVYAAQAFSKHGEESLLSEQLCARVTTSWKTTGELPVEFVSSAGVRRNAFGAFATIPFTKTRTQIIMKQQDVTRPASLIVSGRDSMTTSLGDDKSFVFRIQSLDTGQIVDVPASVIFKNLPDRIESVSGDVIVTNEKKIHGSTSKSKKPKTTKQQEVAPKNRTGKGDRK